MITFIRLNRSGERRCCDWFICSTLQTSGIYKLGRNVLKSLKVRKFHEYDEVYLI